MQHGQKPHGISLSTSRARQHGDGQSVRFQSRAVSQFIHAQRQPAYDDYPLLCQLAGQLNGEAGLLQHLYRRDGNLRLVVGIEAVVQEQHLAASARFRGGPMAGEPAAKVLAMERRQRQGRHGQRRFAANAQGLPAGREDSHVRRALQHPQSQLHACVEQLLAVIEQQEQPALGQILHQDVEWRTR